MKKYFLKYAPLYELFLQAAVLFVLAAYFIATILSGAVYRYVHERHVPVMYGAAVLFLLIGILKLKQAVLLSHVHTASYQDRMSGTNAEFLTFRQESFFSTTVFAAALVTMIAVPSMGINLSQFSYTDSLGAVYTAPLSSAADSNTGSSFALQDKATQALSQQDMPKKTVIRNSVMNEDTFSTWLSVLYTQLDSCVGANITISGSVWKDSKLFEQNEFAVARMMMVCCAADLQPVGLLAQWENTESLSDGEWVEITGTLSKKPYKDGFDPLIIVESAKKIDPPEREYIYQ